MNVFKFRIVFLVLCFQSCSAQNEMINGLSFVASGEPISQKHVNPVVTINANYAAIMPFGFIKGLKYPKIVFNTDRQWFGERSEGVKQYIGTLKKKNIKIMLKPQIWVWHGEYTGDIEMTNETDWKTLEDSYSKFILDYAVLAQLLKTELFCVGTELEKFIENRPEYWKQLIIEIKKRYKGKITYASNWDEYKRTPFWSQLDYIGVDAYFPVSSKLTPTILDCKAGWQMHKDLMKLMSIRHNKPILFTEFGYRSVDYSGKQPWKSDGNMTQVNLEAQTNTTKALFEEFWDEDWFAGGFLWKWFHNHETSGGANNSQFTPQNKPVQSTIKAQYSNE